MFVKGRGIFAKDQKYVEFACMQPYASIKGEKEHSSALDKINPLRIAEAVMKDTAESITTTLGDKLNIKVFKYKKYECENVAGRTFSTYLLDIPAQLVRSDGKISEIYKDDELYKTLGEPIAPAIEIIPALEVVADQSFLFYGKGIHLNDIMNEYENLKKAIIDYKREIELKEEQKKEQKKETKCLEEKKKSSLLDNMPRISLPKFGKNVHEESVTVEQDETIMKQKEESLQ